MSKSKVIVGIDVDLTVVDSLTPWVCWFKAKTGIDFDPKSSAQYDLVPQMRKLCEDKGLIGFDPFEFWRSEDLYDSLEPIDGAMKAIEEMKNEFFFDLDLVYVSHCVPSHEDSKRRFLARYSPKHSFVSTGDKGLVNYDILIDDNTDVLKKAMIRRPQSIHVSYKKFNHWTPTPKGAIEMNEWDGEHLMGLVEQALNSKSV